MKIVVLDGYSLNPGDLSWEAFEKIAQLKVYDRTAYQDKAEIIARIGDADAVLTNKVPIDAEILAAAPKLSYIGVLATGYNVVDIQAAKDAQIKVTNIPAYSTESVAQLSFALLLEIVNQVGLHNQSVHDGQWQNSPDFSYQKAPLIELQGKTIGLIGYGQIAQATARIAHAFNLKVIYWNHRPKAAQAEWAKQVSLEELYQQADIISLHVPQTKETEEMINQDAVAKMKDGVILLNTGRGGLINEVDLAQALNSGKIYAAGLDVVTKEPISADNPLLTAKNCFMTPHIAWRPYEARQLLMAIALDNLKAFQAGQAKNVVNE